MFIKTYKSTMKTIVRSPLIWSTIVLMIGVATYSILAKPLHGYFDLKIGELVYDTDPRFEVTYEVYIKRVLNTMMTTPLMLFSAPAFCVIVSGTILQRDWHDNFFEIERSGDVKPSRYFLGRFTAVLSFVSFVTLVIGIFAFHLYFVSRGGVESFTFGDYIKDSTIRNLRVFFASVFPGLLLFIGITFCIGNSLKSGIVGSMGGLLYVLFTFVSSDYLQFRLPQFYKDYLSPVPSKLYQFWAYYDTNWFESDITNPFTTKQMIICLSSMYLIAFVIILISYLCVKRRKI